MIIIFVVLLIVSLELFQIALSKNKWGKFILPILNIMLSVYIIVLLILFELINFKQLIFILFILNIPTFLFFITIGLINKKNAKYLKLLILILFIVILFLNIIYLRTYNLLFISKSENQKISEVLKIKNIETFTPISIHEFESFEDEKNIKYYELKFEISKNEYFNNSLEYSSSAYYNYLTDGEFKFDSIKKDYYKCIILKSELYNEEYFEEFQNIKTNNNIIYIIVGVIILVIVLKIIYYKKG